MENKIMTIEFNLTSLQKEGEEYLSKLMNGKKVEIRQEMLKFLNNAYRREEKEYIIINEYINDFFMVEIYEEML
jgi:hypothetical protein